MRFSKGAVRPRHEGSRSPRLTCFRAEHLAGVSAATADLYGAVIAAGSGNDLFSITDWNAVRLNVVCGPRQVVGIFLTGRSEAATVDEVEKPVLRMQVGEEGYG